MKVLHLVGTLNPGGIERIVSQLAITQKFEQGIVPIVACLIRREGIFLNSLTDAGISVYECNYPGSAPWVLSRKLFNLIKLDRPDIIHSHVNFSLLWQSIPKVICSLPLVYTQHSLSKDAKKFSHRLLSWLGYKVVSRERFAHTAVSDFAANYVAGLYPTTRQSITIVYNGIDHQAFSFDPSKRERIRNSFNISSDTIVIGCIGRLDYVKGYDILIQAFSRLIAGLPGRNIRLLIVGAGDLKDELVTLSKNCTVSDKIIWAGHSGDVQAMLSAFDLYVQTSRWESASLTILEALANNLRVITSQKTGSLDYSQYFHNIVHLKSQDPTTIANAISQELINLPRSVNKDSDFPDIFETRYMAKKYKEIYDSF